MADKAVAVPVPVNKQFPCKQCGAELDYAPGTEVLKCPYCGAETPIPQSEEHIEELDFQEYLKKLAGEHETQEEHRVKCEKCGAETTMPQEVTAGTCPFCGANLVFTTRTSRLLKPNALLPFKITQTQGFEDFRRWINGLWFAPNDLKKYAQSEGKLAGIYVPYWTYDSDTTSFYRGARGDDYWETETYTAEENGRSVTRTREVRRTRWTSVSGTVWNRFDDVLVVASNSLPRKYADRLQPWDLPNLVSYSDEYLSGFRAESYQVDLSAGFEIARNVMDEGIRASVHRDIGGDHQRIDSVKTSYGKITFKHILLPVWLSAYRYRDKIYRILINARTGELQGERPFSAWKIAAAVAAAIVIIGILVVIGSLHR
jgi:DNA-directed RNA polymerase subunit RPC12/RpoP